MFLAGVGEGERATYHSPCYRGPCVSSTKLGPMSLVP